MRALELADVLRSAGLKVVEVDGWRARGGEMIAVRGGVVHHTATAASAKGDYPTMNVVTHGRADLPGPLAQLGLGRDGTWYVIASGRANHAGVVHDQLASAYSNYYALGVEAEHPGGNAPWPSDQYESYVRGCRALGEHYAIRWMGHKEVAAPAGRKSDPNFDMNAFRAAIAAPVTTEDDDMPLSDEDIDRIAQRVWNYSMSGGDLPGSEVKVPRETAGERLRQLRRSTFGGFNVTRAARDSAAQAATVATETLKRQTEK